MDLSYMLSTNQSRLLIYEDYIYTHTPSYLQRENIFSRFKKQKVKKKEKEFKKKDWKNFFKYPTNFNITKQKKNK